jgi:RHS repeat-associated protein
VRLTWELRTPVVLASSEWLGENQTRVSLDGAYRLQYQGDGNLVVVRLADDSSAWSSQTNSKSVGATMMQGDGNLVIYNGDWTGIWSTGTWGHDGARLEIANDTMAIVGPDETTLWSVSLAAAPELPTAWAGATMGTLLGASSGPSGRAAGVLLFIVALFGLAANVVRRPWAAPERQTARRSPVAAGRLRARLPATALLLAAMLMVPANALAQIPTQVIEYYHTDALGSVRAVTKQVNGQWHVVARHDFMPFGEEVAPPTPPQEKRLFTGKERDNETGMDYFGARYVRGSSGRFTTVDPLMVIEENLIDPQKWNRYAYVTNNPQRYVDPDGRYGMDVHYWMTWALARAAGYAPDRALTIATADASVDIARNPMDPLFDFDRRGDYHFPSADRKRAVETALDSGGLSDSDFGTNLHVFQDSTSHAGYDKYWGHLFAGHEPDITASHMTDALKMAEQSFNKLQKNAGASASTLKWSDIQDYVERALNAKSQFAKEAIYLEMIAFIDKN